MASQEAKQTAPNEGQLRANMIQIAVLNKLLPKGFRFELKDSVASNASKNQVLLPVKDYHVSQSSLI